MAASKKPVPPPKPKQKHWYQITVDAVAPIRVMYRVHSFSEQEAYETYLKNPTMAAMDGRPHIDLHHMQKKKITIKNLITGVINFIKTF